MVAARVSEPMALADRIRDAEVMGVSTDYVKARAIIDDRDLLCPASVSHPAPPAQGKENSRAADLAASAHRGQVDGMAL